METYEIKGKTMTIVLRPDNIVEVIDNKEWDQPDTLEIIRGDTDLIRKVIDGQPRGLLIEPPNRHIRREIMKHLENVELGAVARVVVMNSFATKVFGNLYLKLSKGKTNEAGRIVPAKLFTNKEDAIKWLLERMEEEQV